MPDCEHRWVRLPMVRFSFDYWCRECSLLDQVLWTEKNVGMSMEQIDEEFIACCGGTFEGEGYMDVQSA